ncbi:MAG TPA: response regulator transcription factor, partial [Stenotrophomonas sp.]
MPSLLIADDHPLFRAALRQAASEAVSDLSVREAESLEGVLAALDAAPDTDLILLDLHMPGNHGLAGLAAIRAQHPGVAVIVVSANDDPRVVRRALDHGAAGYLPKSSGLNELREAIRSVMACEQWLPASLRASVSRAQSSSHDSELAARLASLSPQQFRVLALVAEGLLNKQIA